MKLHTNMVSEQRATGQRATLRNSINKKHLGLDSVRFRLGKGLGLVLGLGLGSGIGSGLALGF